MWAIGRFLYLAVVLDGFSRHIVGWAMAGHLHTELVLAALDMALAQRRAAAVIHHSDHGCQYIAFAFGARCRFSNHAEARQAIFAFIEGWYNTRRRHSALDYLSPNDYERRYHADTAHPSAELST